MVFCVFCMVQSEASTEVLMTPLAKRPMNCSVLWKVLLRRVYISIFREAIFDGFFWGRSSRTRLLVSDSMTIQRKKIPIPFVPPRDNFGEMLRPMQPRVIRSNARWKTDCGLSNSRHKERTSSRFGKRGPLRVAVGHQARALWEGTLGGAGDPRRYTL